MEIKKTIKAAFLYELSKIYNAECIVCTVLPNITPKLHSADLKRALRSYVDGSRLTVGKMEILFHLVGYRATSVDHNLVSHLVDECRHLALASQRIHDVVTTSLVQQILHLKVSSCETLIYLAERLHNETAMSLLKEIHDYELHVLHQLSVLLHVKSNGFARKELLRVS